MRFLRNPVVQFLAVGLLVFAGLLVTTSVLSSRAAAREAVTDARSRAWLLAHAVVEPALTDGLARVDPGAVDRFDRTVGARLEVTGVVRIKVWRSDGTIVYSDEPRLIGDRFPLGKEEAEILRDGGSEAEVTDLSKPENRFEHAPPGGLLEVYTRVETHDHTPLLFEVYFTTSDIETRKQQVFGPFQRITAGALVMVLLVATPMIWLLTRRLTRAGRERERLLRAAVTASEAERRRIARDLHDGVVQDLAGTAFSVSAVARSADLAPEARQDLQRAGASLRSSMRSLRSLLVEIHPPELHADGLAAALTDLVAPAQSAGIDATVVVTGVNDASDEVVALVWRVAQETVRNAIRHSGCHSLRVEVAGVGPHVALTVADDGRGFDPAPRRADDASGFGLQGLRSLADDGGGRLTVTSAPVEGTTVHLEVTR